MRCSIPFVVLFSALTLTFACGMSAFAYEDAADEAGQPDVVQADGTGPCVSDPEQEPIVAPTAGTPVVASKRPDVIDLEKMPWLVESANLPANHPTLKRPKMLWAKSFLWAEAPKIEVEEWITEKPDMDGKYLLVEVWATWCPPCRRSLATLEYFHEKYKDELCVISICETDHDALKKMKGPTELDDIKCHLAVDTQRRFADELGCFGIPHCVIIEPQYGCVIWEGMPTLPGHELNEEIIERILAIGRKIKAQETAKN